jgi:multidrug efflux pump subunit AcrB
MSAITTILGVAPLIIFKDPLFFSMAVVIAFGLAFGTILTLVVVPVIYSLFFGARYPGAAAPEPVVAEPAAAQ